MITSVDLLKHLQRRVTLLEEDLRRRCDAEPQVNAPLQAQYETARANKRTAETFNAWRDEQITQIAVAWVLACVFVRFLEDNQLLDTPFLAGPDSARMTRARDEQELFFKQHPTASERDYLLHVFAAVGQLPGMREFFDRRHNPLWLAGPTGDALAGLLDFWRKSDPDTGKLTHDFSDARVSSLPVPSGEGEGRLPAEASAQAGGEIGENGKSEIRDPKSEIPDPTRFLGDLYQDLSEAARKRFALLQTPVFVEEFILDRTLTPAIQTFGYKVVRMIDPTCGSGHFCLGGFDRLFRLWQEGNPGENPRVLAQRALDGIYGVDLNPYAVAIARFRLLLAALRVSGINKLKNAPDFRIHLATGDSLLHGRRFREHEGFTAGPQMTFNTEDIFRDELKHHYEVEDVEALHRILGQQYHAVVGNPPYITVKDRAVSELYRARYPSCHRRFSLSVPFMERFFELAVKGDGTPQQPAGCVGQITANTFMKREFGKKLIEEYLPRWDLTHVLDTAGAYIPGHGTPTVILFGKNQPPASGTIRTVLGIRAESAKPSDPAHGIVWQALVRQVDEPGSVSEWVSAADSVRASFHQHPWSIGGGGAAELKELLDEESTRNLSAEVDSMGFASFPCQDDVFLSDSAALLRGGIPSGFIRPFAPGEVIRDWSLSLHEAAFTPYGSDHELVPYELNSSWGRHLWHWRTSLEEVLSFGGKTRRESGESWWAWYRWLPEKYADARSIVFANIATHNHFAFVSGGVTFKQTSPVIKLAPSASEAAFVHLVGLLNSSTGCFWLRQVCFPKGGSGIGRGIQPEAWEGRLAFDSTKLADFPIPARQPSQLPTALVKTSTVLQGQSPAATLASWGGPESGDLRPWLASARDRAARHRRQLIAWQEELDWQIYEAFGLVASAKASAHPRVEPAEQVALPEGEAMDAIPPEGIGLGQRAFEIVLARRMAAGEAQSTWFERHGSTPITEVPRLWPAPYRELVERRIRRIESDPNIRLIEQPEYKRRWNTEPWDEQQERALRQWLLNRLEGYFFEGERMFLPRPATQERGEGQGEGSSDDRPTSPQPSPPLRGGEGDPLGDPGARNAADGVGLTERATRVSLITLRASWPAGQRPTLISTNQLADIVQADATFLKAAEVYAGAAGFSVPKLVRELVEAESVPFLPFQRYKESGVRKRQDWERTWDLQRREDAIEEEVRRQSAEGRPGTTAATEHALQAEIKARQKTEVGEIPVPPKYASADFKSSTFWRLRGKLDVPKERWVSYPGAEREGDPSPVIAWAGWNHLQQAQALAEYYITAKETWGWSPERLTLLLAGLADLLPWLKQWHNDPNPEYGMGLGDYFAGFLDEECRKNGTTVEWMEGRRLGKQS